MNMLPLVYIIGSKRVVGLTLEGAVASDSLVLIRGFERIGEHIISV